MKKRIKDLFKKAYSKLFRKKTSGIIIERKPDGTIHIYGDVFVHGNIYGMGSVNNDASFTKRGD